jgi:TolA-binding protein
MRGRWASAALGATTAYAIARHRAGNEMDQQAQAYQQQIEAQQRQIEALQQQQKQQPQQSSNQEDLTQKLQKLADLKQKGVLTDEEFHKLKMQLISKV